MAKTARQVQASDISGNQEQNTANMVKSVYQTYIENMMVMVLIYLNFS